MRSVSSGLAIVVICVLTASVAEAQSFDLVINNGRVMDPETMYDDMADVGIEDGRIAVITEDVISGKETSDAKRLVVGALMTGAIRGVRRRPHRLA